MKQETSDVLTIKALLNNITSFLPFYLRMNLALVAKSWQQLTNSQPYLIHHLSIIVPWLTPNPYNPDPLWKKKLNITDLDETLKTRIIAYRCAEIGNYQMLNSEKKWTGKDNHITSKYENFFKNLYHTYQNTNTPLWITDLYSIAINKYKQVRQHIAQKDQLIFEILKTSAEKTNSAVAFSSTRQYVPISSKNK